jgi:hypothetical protein
MAYIGKRIRGNVRRYKKAGMSGLAVHYPSNLGGRAVHYDAGLSGCGAMGLGDCGTDQIVDPSQVVGGYAQCVSTTQYLAAHPGAKLVFDGTKWIDQAAATTSSQNDGSTIGSIAGAISKIFGTSQPTAPVIMPSTGPDTTTIVLLGGAALVGVYLLTRK